MKILRKLAPRVQREPEKEVTLPPPPAAAPSIPAVVEVIQKRLGRARHVYWMYTEDQIRGKSVHGAELSWASLSREAVITAFSDLPMTKPLSRGPLFWGHTHTAAWEYISERFRVRIALYRYRDHVSIVCTTLFRTAEEDAEAEARDAARAAELEAKKAAQAAEAKRQAEEAAAAEPARPRRLSKLVPMKRRGPNLVRKGP